MNVPSSKQLNSQLSDPRYVNSFSNIVPMVIETSGRGERGVVSGSACPPCYN